MALRDFLTWSDSTRQFDIIVEKREKFRLLWIARKFHFMTDYVTDSLESTLVFGQKRFDFFLTTKVMFFTISWLIKSNHAVTFNNFQAF